MFRTIFAALLASAALFGANAAQAGTQWSIGISLPFPGVVVSNGGGYYAQDPGPSYYVQEPAPVYYAPPVRYAPAPRYVEREVYYAAPPAVYYAPAYRERGWGDRDDRQRRWAHERHDRRDHQERWERDHEEAPRWSHR